MYLFEFENEGDIVNTIRIAADRLEQMRQEGKLKQNWTVDQLLDFFNDYFYKSNFNFTLDKDDLYGMMQTKPLKTTVTNIQGDEVVFKGNAGQEAPEAPPPEQSKEVVNKMAKKTLGK